MGNPPTDDRWTLLDLPLAARLCLAAFMISVGLGYFSALVNLHFQEATPGKVLPDEDDVIGVYHGKSKMSQMERLLIAHPAKPFNGDGTMRPAFMKRFVKLRKKDREAVAGRLQAEHKELKIGPQDPRVEERFYKEVDGERIALIAWLRDGAKREAYDKNSFKLEGKLKDLVINPDFVKEDDKGRYAAIHEILDVRCARCHQANGSGGPAQFPLEEWEDITHYTSVERGGKSLPKLALTTHVHLLSFSMLYGLTGLILALTPLPGWIRVPLAPLALVAQVVDVAFWWLARVEEPYGPMFAKGIMVTGGIVALALGFQILLTLFSIFGRVGKVVLVMLLAAAIFGGFLVNRNYVEPHLSKERETMEVLKE